MDTDNKDGGRAPLFGKWVYWYILVIGFLLFCILVFDFLTKHFS
ncbi:MAG TPA: hypothetical protein VGQ51_12845 [Puia sp.]|jgi:hypothetical protein|nr:hypothetical protein [Puia sp.]